MTLSVGMGDVLDHLGQKIATDSLFQLVRLGGDGMFNPIPAGAWVGGDDALIAQSFPNSDGWTSASAFDLTNGVGTAGVFSRQFTFTLGSDMATGDKIGIRWFPTVKASDFALTPVTIGLPYGQFTRQSSPLCGGDTWVVPGSGSLVSFDPMITSSNDPIDGLDSNLAGAATNVVVPEPGSVTLIGLASLLLFRRLRPSTFSRLNNHRCPSTRYMPLP